MLTAILLPTVLVPCLALTFDGGALYHERQEAQTAADAAALAAAQSCAAGTPDVAAQVAYFAEANVSLGTVTATSSGCGASSIRVDTVVSGPSYFAGIWGVTSLTASATATAAWEVGEPSGGDADVCTIFDLALVGGQVYDLVVEAVPGDNGCPLTAPDSVGPVVFARAEGARLWTQVDDDARSFAWVGPSGPHDLKFEWANDLVEGETTLGLTE